MQLRALRLSFISLIVLAAASLVATSTSPAFAQEAPAKAEAPKKTVQITTAEREEFLKLRVKVSDLQAQYLSKIQQAKDQLETLQKEMAAKVPEEGQKLQADYAKLSTKCVAPDTFSVDDVKCVTGPAPETKHKELIPWFKPKK